MQITKLVFARDYMGKRKYGQRTFSYAVPKLWNTSPANVHSLKDVELFKKAIKTILIYTYSILVISMVAIHLYSSTVALTTCAISEIYQKLPLLFHFFQLASYKKCIGHQGKKALIRYNEIFLKYGIRSIYAYYCAPLDRRTESFLLVILDRAGNTIFKVGGGAKIQHLQKLQFFF